MNVTNNVNEQNVVILVQIFSQSLCDNTETQRRHSKFARYVYSVWWVFVYVTVLK